jgi:hypothetical protein
MLLTEMMLMKIKGVQRNAVAQIRSKAAKGGLE